MSEAKAPEALHRTQLGLEDPCEGRFAVYNEVLALQQLCCVRTLGHVHNHRPVRLWQILPAEPGNFRNAHLVLLFQHLYGACSMLTELVQDRRPACIVYLDHVPLVP